MMPSPTSKWWHAPDDAELDYGFDSDDLDARFAEPAEVPRRLPPTHEERERREEETGGRGVLGTMSAWLQRQAGSHNSQLVLSAVLSGAAVAGAILGYQTYRRKEAVHHLKASIPAIDDEYHAEKVRYLETGCM